MKEKLRKIFEHYGIEVQARQTMEECAELIQALNKHLRLGNYETVLAIAEEIADVQIMLEQMKIYFDIGRETARLMEGKISRAFERMRCDDTEKND